MMMIQLVDTSDVINFWSFALCKNPFCAQKPKKARKSSTGHYKLLCTFDIQQTPFKIQLLCFPTFNTCLLSSSLKLCPLLTLSFYCEPLKMGPTPLDIQQTIQRDTVRGFHLHIIIKAADAIGKCKPKNFKGK